MTPPESAEEIRKVNRRYHDVAAVDYDTKWGVGFGELWQNQVLRKWAKLLGNPVGPFESALEIGAGTGYFTLNLMQAGVIKHATCTDISDGMLATLAANAAQLNLDVKTVPADAEDLPFEDNSFDLVHGHAILHHLPDLDRAFSEFRRVLKPGGVVFFAGEPSQYGDKLASFPKKLGAGLAPLWRQTLGVRQSSELDPDHDATHDHQLETMVDVHAFTPQVLERHARTGGFENVRVRGEELLASWFGWVNRSLETSADPTTIPQGWIKYAANGYLFLQRIDRQLLEQKLPAAAFYNLMIAARKPHTGE